MTTTRHASDQAQKTAAYAIDLLRDHCSWIEIAGSLRRQETLVKDVELVAIPLPTLHQHMDDLLSQGVIDKARYGAKQATRWGPKYRGMLVDGIKCELFLCDEDNRGYIHWLRTGPDRQGNRGIPSS